MLFGLDIKLETVNQCCYIYENNTYYASLWKKKNDSKQYGFRPGYDFQ